MKYPLILILFIGQLRADEHSYMYFEPIQTELGQSAQALEQPQAEAEQAAGSEESSSLEVIVMEEEPPPAPVNKSDLQNWLFAAGTVVVGTLVALLVGWSQGNPP